MLLIIGATRYGEAITKRLEKLLSESNLSMFQK